MVEKFLGESSLFRNRIRHRGLERRPTSDIEVLVVMCYWINSNNASSSLAMIISQIHGIAIARNNTVQFANALGTINALLYIISASMANHVGAG